MATRFLGTDAWKRIKVLNKRRGQRLVAVPYLGEGAARRLTLSAGDVLVVRLDEVTVKCGQTSPKDVLAYLKRGVEVHRQSNLHAKVFVFGNTAVIGSTNVSASSEGTLVEAAVETTASSIVASAKRFVRSLRGDLVTPREAERLEKIYRRPQFSGRARGKKNRAARIGTGQTPMWVVPLSTGGWDDADYAVSEREKPKARRKLKNTRYFEVDDFLWEGSGFSSQIQKGQRVLQVTREDDGRTLVTAPARVIGKHSYGTGPKRKTLILVELRKSQRRRALKVVCKRLGRMSKPLTDRRDARKIKAPALVYGIGQLWGARWSET